MRNEGFDHTKARKARLGGTSAKRFLKGPTSFGQGTRKGKNNNAPRVPLSENKKTTR